MRILLLAKDYPPTIGGVENYSKNLAEGLSAKNNVTVVSFAPKNGGNVYPDQLEVIRLNPISSLEFFKAFQLFFFLINYLWSREFDIVIGTTWKVSLPITILKVVKKLNLLVITHGAEITRHKRSEFTMFLMNLVLRSAQKIISVSKFTRSKVLEYNSGLDESNVIVVPNGINFERLEPVELKIAREKLDIDKDDFIILTVSRVDNRKGHDVVIKSLPTLIKFIPNLKYIVVGDGPSLIEIKKLATSLELQNFVKFTGFIDSADLDFYYSLCDLFVLLNKMEDDKDFEGFGLVFAEAGYYSKTVIAGSNGGPPEVIQYGKTGYLVEPKIDSFIDLIHKENLMDKGHLQEIGERAKEYVIQEFSIDIMIERSQRIINSINH